MAFLCKYLPHSFFLWKALCLADDGMVSSPSSFDFGSVYWSLSVTQTFTLTNTNARKNVSSIAQGTPALSAPFSFLGGSFPGTGGTCSANTVLAPSESCTIVLAFSPQNAQGFSGTLNLSYQLQNAPRTLAVSVSGTGLEKPVISIDEGSAYDFFERPVGATVNRYLNIRNAGVSPIVGFTIASPPSSPFSLVNRDCPIAGTLSAGSTCQLKVTFTPSQSASYSGALSLSTASGLGTVSLTLSGAGQSLVTVGTLDSVFGIAQSGFVSTDLGGVRDSAAGFALGEDDGMIAVGSVYSGSSNDFGVARYLANGSLDTRFNSNGKVTVDFNSVDDSANSVVRSSTGVITVTGNSGEDCAFARFLSNGTLDTGFNTTGKLTLDLNSGSTDQCVASALDSSGRMIVVGTSFKDPQYKLALLRLTTSGVLDTTFATTGNVLASFGGGNTFGQTVRLQADGKIVVAGTAAGAANFDYLVARYGTDGTLDTTFNQTGSKLINFATSNDNASDLAIDGDGSIYVAGKVSAVSSDQTMTYGIAKLLSDGTLDNSFGNNGIIRPPATQGTDVSVALNLLANGNLILAWGQPVDSRPFFLKLISMDSHGALLTGFGGTGTVTTSVYGNRGKRPALSVQSDTKVLLGGTTYLGGQWDFAFERRW